MNREIKFNGWDEKQRKMYSAEELGADQLTINPDGRGFINVSSVHVNLSMFYPHIKPLQYTGLQDKNGKEIYEDDVVQGFYGGSPKYSPDIITFQNGAFWLKDISLTLHQWLEYDGVYTAALEVIGNIYENPELIQLNH